MTSCEIKGLEERRFCELQTKAFQTVLEVLLGGDARRPVRVRCMQDTETPTHK